MNDVSLEDESVSRFHAFFQNESGAWTLTDAESKNGTFVETVRLLPNKPYAVRDGMRLRFGDLEVRFLTAESFVKQLWNRMTGAK